MFRKDEMEPIGKLLLIQFKFQFVTARKRSLGQSNIFIGVCQEFCSQGGVSASVHAGIHPPLGSRHPVEQTPPREQMPPRSRHPLEQTPPTADTPGSRPPPEQAHPPSGADTPHPPAQNMLGDTVNARALRILLECILVILSTWLAF